MAPKKRELASQLGDRVQRGSRGATWEHFRLICEVFLRYFGALLEVFVIDVGGMFFFLWEVFWTYTKGMSNVCWM